MALVGRTIWGSLRIQICQSHDNVSSFLWLGIPKYAVIISMPNLVSTVLILAAA